MPHAFAGVVARAFIMDIAKRALNRIGTWAIGRQIEQLKARMGREPLLDFLGLVNLGIIGHNREVGIEGRRVGAVECVEQIQEEPRGFPIPDTVGDSPRGELQRSGQVAFLVGAWGHHLDLGAFGHPLIAHLGQAVNIQLVGKEQRRAGPQLLKRATNPRQLLHALGIVILGPELGPLPLPV